MRAYAPSLEDSEWENLVREILSQEEELWGPEEDDPQLEEELEKFRIRLSREALLAE